jgi:hypothetical protein
MNAPNSADWPRRNYQSPSMLVCGRRHAGLFPHLLDGLPVGKVCEVVVVEDATPLGQRVSRQRPPTLWWRHETRRTARRRNPQRSAPHRAPVDCRRGHTRAPLSCRGLSASLPRSPISGSVSPQIAVSQLIEQDRLGDHGVIHLMPRPCVLTMTNAYQWRRYVQDYCAKMSRVLHY